MQLYQCLVVRKMSGNMMNDLIRAKALSQCKLEIEVSEFIKEKGYGSDIYATSKKSIDGSINYYNENSFAYFVGIGKKATGIFSLLRRPPMAILELSEGSWKMDIKDEKYENEMQILSHQLTVKFKSRIDTRTHPARKVRI